MTFLLGPVLLLTAHSPDPHLQPEEMQRLGLIQWAQQYQEVIDKLNMIAQDGAITVEESEDWCDQAYEALERGGYWDDEE